MNCPCSYGADILLRVSVHGLLLNCTRVHNLANKTSKLYKWIELDFFFTTDATGQLYIPNTWGNNEVNPVSTTAHASKCLWSTAQGREPKRNPVGSVMMDRAEALGTSWLEFNGLNIRDGRLREAERVWRKERDRCRKNRAIQRPGSGTKRERPGPCQGFPSGQCTLVKH